MKTNKPTAKQANEQTGETKKRPSATSADKCTHVVLQGGQKADGAKDPGSARALILFSELPHPLLPPVYRVV